MIIGFDASRAFVPERTGTENYSYQLLRHLAKIDNKNHYRVYLRPLVSSLPGETLRGWPENFEFKVIGWKRLWTQGGLALECLKNPPDILFVPAHTLPIIRRPGLKTVVTIHDLGSEYLPEYHQFPQKYYLNWSTIYAVRNATKIIAVSENTRQDLITSLQSDPLIISLIYEAVDTVKLEIRISKSETERVLRKYNIQKPYILFVGTIQPRKNVERLIEAYSNVILKRAKRREGSKDSSPLPQNDNLNLVLVGKPGWMNENIYKAPKKHNVANSVKFLGFVPEEEMSILYKEASVFCLPSLFEGFGLPVLEAMSYGVPVVASNTSSLPEVVGDAGVLVDPENTDDIAKSLEKILTKKKFREGLVEKGLARVKKFTWEETSRQTLRVLEEAYKTSI